MRLTTITTALVAAIVIDKAHAWTYCTYTTADYFAGYSIVAPNVADIPGICGGLWDNLKHFADCIGVSAPSCYDEGSNTIAWQFTNGISCNVGMVESAWYEATKNQYGALDCQEVGIS